MDANQENPVLSPSPDPILGVSVLELSSGHTWFESEEDSSTSCLCMCMWGEGRIQKSCGRD